MNTLNQKIRLIILLIYISLLFIASWLAFGNWIPSLGEKGLWFYSGIASLLLGSLLATPFYTKPVDAISYAVSAIIGMLSVNIWTIGSGHEFDRILWLAISVYIAIILLSGIISIGLRDARREATRNISTSLYVLCDSIGGPKAIFSAVFLFAIVAFHKENPREFITLGVTWIFVIALQPLETVVRMLAKLKKIWLKSQNINILGEVIAYQNPGILMVNLQAEYKPSFGSLIAVVNSDQTVVVGMLLDKIMLAGQSWLRIKLLEHSIPNKKLLGVLSVFGQASVSIAVSVDEETVGDLISNVKAYSQKSSFIGLVAPETDIAKLRIEILHHNIDLEEGRLIEVKIKDQYVIYQLMNGITKEEILHQKNTYGYARAEAKKIGTWNPEKTRFEIAKWIPMLNEPVYLVEETVTCCNKDAVGHFPKTNYPIQIEPHTLVTHNTAILGILGAGKSYLAFELVERMIFEKIKVICFDLTNQYARYLEPFYDMNSENEIIQKIKEIGKSGKTTVKQNVEEGGSVKTVKEAISDDLKFFLRTSDKYLKIYNPAFIEVWRQDSKMYQNTASMASLTPAEITRLITESVLEILQDEMCDRARACIIFEEAHSLIPEWSSVASEGDKSATNGTAKAILQGRKYGLGCIVITQRTANVTKSILNQCNTVFALRVFDATGMEFLKNYIGDDYASVLSTLEDRQAVLFGKASSCSEPVLLRLNDRDEFIREFRSDVIAGKEGEV